MLGRAREGDSAAASELLNRLMPLLRRRLRHRIRPYDDIDDTLQDCLVAIAAALPGFRGEGSLLHFATKVAPRSVLSRHRNSHRHDGRSARAAKLELPLVNPPPAPDEGSLEGRRHDALVELMSELTSAEAQMVVLAVVGEQSLAEIAEVTGVPVNVVKSRLRHARRWLRSRIDSDSVLAELLHEDLH